MNKWTDECVIRSTVLLQRKPYTRVQSLVMTLIYVTDENANHAEVILGADPAGSQIRHLLFEIHYL